jgi:hypothetical protein
VTEPLPNRQDQRSEPLWTPEDVELLARTLYEADRLPDDESWAELSDFDADSYRKVARAQLAALAEAGRLAGGETHSEWASEHGHHHFQGQPDPLILETGRNKMLAEVRVKTWRTTYPLGTHRLLRRDVTTAAGPWVPGDTEALEDMQDVADAQRSLADPAPRISLEEVEARYATGVPGDTPQDQDQDSAKEQPS